jgi:hypothetical protein
MTKGEKLLELLRKAGYSNPRIEKHLAWTDVIVDEDIRKPEHKGDSKYFWKPAHWLIVSELGVWAGCSSNFQSQVHNLDEEYK